jgi:PKD repeat protein
MTGPDRQSYILRIVAIFFWLILSVSFVPSLYAQAVNFVVVDPASGTGCRPLTVTFLNNSDATNTSSFTWDFGDGSPQETYPASNAGQNVVHTFNNPGVYAPGLKPGQHEVRLTLIPNTGTIQIEIQIIEEYFADIPQAKASAQVLCGGNVIFSNLSDPGITPGPRTTNWDFGDGTFQTAGTEDVTHTYSFASDSTYTVKMINQNMCGADSTTLQVTVYHADNQINIQPGATLCVNNGAVFNNPGHKDQMTYAWDFSDGTTSTEFSPTHEFTSDGNYIVTMAVEIPNSQECSDTISLPVTVLPGPKASFTMDYDTTCDQADVSYVNMSTGVQDSWSWNFGNGDISTDQNPSSVYHYDSTGNYLVSLVAENSANGCSDTATQILFVPSSPLALFSADNVCLGLPAMFTDVSVTDPGTPVISWSWDFGGGQTSTDQNPSLVFGSPGPQQVTLNVATSYCGDDTMMTVVVENLPHPAFSVPATEGCSPLEVVFDNYTPDAVSFQWIFGDNETDTATSPIHEYTTPAGLDTIYNAKLIASTLFGCRDSVSVAITVHFTPEALFTHDASVIPFCTRDTVTFTSRTVSADALEWDFDDGQTGSDSVETVIFENDNYYFKHFLVNLVAVSVNGCRDTSETAYISLYPRPRSDFVPDTSDNCHPASIGFLPRLKRMRNIPGILVMEVPCRPTSMR